MNIFNIAKSLIENVAAPGDSKDLVKFNIKELEKTVDQSEFGGDKRKYYEALKSRAEGGEGLFKKKILDFIEELPEEVIPKSGRSYFIKYLANAMKDDVRVSEADVAALGSKYMALDHDPVALPVDYRKAIKRAHGFTKFMNWFETKDKNLWPETRRTEYVAWLADQFSERFRASDTELEEIRDYFIGHNYDLNILNSDYTNVVAEAREWHESFGREAAGMYITPPRKNTIYNVDGFIVVEISTDKCTQEEILNDCKVEGSLMGNCIGSIHARYVAEGREKIYSIRSPGAKQIPHVSISFQDGKIDEIKAKSNKQVRNPRYRAATLKFLVSHFSAPQILGAERGWIHSVPAKELLSINMPGNDVLQGLIAVKTGINAENIRHVEQLTDETQEIPSRASGSFLVYFLAKKCETENKLPAEMFQYNIPAEDLRKIVKAVPKVVQSDLCPYKDGLNKLVQLCDAVTTGDLSYFSSKLAPPKMVLDNFFKSRINEFGSLPPKHQEACIWFVNSYPELKPSIQPYLKENAENLNPKVLSAYIYTLVENEEDIYVNGLNKEGLRIVLAKAIRGEIKGTFSKLKITSQTDDLSEKAYKAAIRSVSKDRGVKESGLKWLRNNAVWVLQMKNNVSHPVKERIAIAVDERIVLNMLLSGHQSPGEVALYDLMQPAGLVKKITRKTYEELLPELTGDSAVDQLLNEKYGEKPDASKYLAILDQYKAKFLADQNRWDDNIEIVKALSGLTFEQVPEEFKSKYSYTITPALMRKKNTEYCLKYMEENKETQYLAAICLPLEYLPQFKTHRNPTVRAAVARRLPIDQVQDMASDSSSRVREVIQSKMGMGPRRASIAFISERIAFWQ